MGEISLYELLIIIIWRSRPSVFGVLSCNNVFGFLLAGGGGDDVLK